jgi:hypothetical protein
MEGAALVLDFAFLQGWSVVKKREYFIIKNAFLGIFRVSAQTMRQMTGPGYKKDPTLAGYQR